jgi:elongation factor G
MATTTAKGSAPEVAVRPTDRIRNVAVIGQHGSGKTALVDALLMHAGATSRPLGPNDPEEAKRDMTLSLSLAPCEWKGFKINLFDTPGFADFLDETEAAMSVCDLAIVVVSGVDGVEAETERLWRRAAQLGLPRMVFVSELDRERADFERTLAQLTSTFGEGIAPLELPIGTEASLTGIADLLTDTAVFADGTTGPIPAELEEHEHEVHDQLVEGIVVADDEQLARFLDGDIPTVDELEHTLAVGVAHATVFPVVCGSAVTGAGIDKLADFICELGPSPADRPAISVSSPAGDIEVMPDASAQPLAYVFKTIADPFVGQLSVFKVLSGTIKADEKLINPRTGTEERLHGLFSIRGKEQIPVGAVPAGDIAAVAKLASTRTGDTLAFKGTPVTVPHREMAPPQYPVAIRAKTQADDDKLSSALARLLDEDPSLRLHRDDETHQTVLRGHGDTQIAVAIERLARKFGVNIELDPVLVAYRETVVGTAQAEGKVKKQSGGHGQYAVAMLRVAPRDRGAGFEFVDAIVGGVIPRQYIPAVQKGIEEQMASGGVHGFPVVDLSVTCFDGKYHSVDSSEMAFKTAASIGLKDAMASAGVAVLEPVSVVEITVPSSHQGDVMGDITSRRGRVQGTEALEHGDQKVTALIPTAEISRYAIDLRSMTGGRGRFVAHHDHYDVLPSHLVEAAKATRAK